jgi:diguanylate cyclase (GGDEF)-like protein
MKQILWKAAVVAVIAMLASFAIVMTIVPAVGGVVDGNALFMIFVCPLLTAFPASIHLFRQKKVLAVTLQDLKVAHEELADAHLQLAEAHARLSEKARYDDMTGVLNRAAFMSALNSTRRRTDAGMLLIIDADNFKYVNDTHGHQQGDAALQLISHAIRQSVRVNDIVGRIGGEEFSVFLVDADIEEGLVVAERVRLAVEGLRFSPSDGKYLPMSVSIGAARFRRPLSWSQIMREADSRLYEAKRRGRNRVVFEEDARRAA